MLQNETSNWGRGLIFIAGIDEVGRGLWWSSSSSSCHFAKRFSNPRKSMIQKQFIKWKKEKNFFIRNTTEHALGIGIQA